MYIVHVIYSLYFQRYYIKFRPVAPGLHKKLGWTTYSSMRDKMLKYKAHKNCATCSFNLD